MMVRSACVAAVLVLTACGQQQPQAPVADTPASSGPTRAEAIERIGRGDAFSVTLDPCEDEGWTEGTDPFGTLKCGETYQVRYDPATAQYTATGFNEPYGGEYTAASAGTDPSAAGISIWGATFIAGDGGVVSTSDGTRAGELSFTGAS